MTTDTSAPARAWVPTDDTFAARLAMVRHRSGWNIKEAAVACGVPPASWRLWEIDGARPRDQVAAARLISGAAGCDFQWLLLGRNEGRVGVTETDPSSTQRVVATVSSRGTGGDPNGLTLDDVRIPRPRGPVHRTRPIMAGPQRPATLEAA